MKSFIAALRSLILPFGATTGARIILDGVNGRISVYDSTNTLVGLVDATGIWQYNANGSSTRLGSGNVPNPTPTPQVLFSPAPFAAAPPTAAEQHVGAIYVWNDEVNRLEVMSLEGPHFNLGSGAASDLYPQIQLISPDYAGTRNSEILLSVSDGSGNIRVTADGFLDVTQSADIVGNADVHGNLTVDGTGLMVVPTLRMVQQGAQALASGVATALTFGAGSEEIARGGAGAWHDDAVNPSRITPNIAGVYDFRGVASMTAAGGGATYSQLVAAIYKNGARLDGPDIARPGVSSAALSALAFATVDMNGSTDYVEIVATQTNSAATAQNTNGAATLRSTFEGRLVSL